jgi:hypothetical protein
LLATGTVLDCCIILGPTTASYGFYVTGSAIAKTIIGTGAVYSGFTTNTIYFGNNTVVNAWTGIQIYAYSLNLTSSLPTYSQFSSYNTGPWNISSANTTISGNMQCYAPLTRYVPSVIPHMRCNVGAGAYPAGVNTCVLTVAVTTGSPQWHFTGNTLTPNQSFVFDAAITVLITFSVNVAVNSGTFAGAYVQANGSTILVENGAWNNTGGNNGIYCSVSVVWNFNVGDYIQFYVQNTSGGCSTYNNSAYATITAIM